jgi:hypothetical protein
MLTKSDFLVYRQAIRSQLEGQEKIAAYFALPIFAQESGAKTQLGVIADAIAPFAAAMKKAGRTIDAPEQIKAFALLLLLGLQKLAPGSKEHLALRDELLGAPKGWHKENPPVNAFDLLSPSWKPSWQEEMSRVGEIASQLDFESLSNPEQVAAAVKNVFGIGGLEDQQDPRALKSTDKAMELFIGLAVHEAMISHPQWIDPTSGQVFKTLPQGVDGRSTFELEHIQNEAIAAEKEKKRKEAAENRKATWGRVRVLGVQLITEKLAPVLEDVIRAVRTTDFSTLKVFIEEYAPPATEIAPLLDMLVKMGARSHEEVVQVARTITIEYILQDVQKRHADWVTTNADGDLIMRRAEPKPGRPFGETKKGKAVYRAVGTLINEYGPRNVLGIVLPMLLEKGIALMDPNLTQTVVEALPDQLQTPYVIPTRGEKDEGEEPAAAAAASA